MKMCTLTDIPLKTDRIRPFLEKHYKQVGALPKVLHFVLPTCQSYSPQLSSQSV